MDGKTELYGNSGRDIIRSDWYRVNGDGTQVNNGGDEVLFGDYKYGSDNLDKDLWGDADRIYGGHGTYGSTESNNAKQEIYGGDGDDYLSPGDSWYISTTYGENGNDTFKAPQGSEYVTFYGGEGDDTVEVAAYGDEADYNYRE